MRVVVKQGSQMPLGRAAGLIMAGIDDLFPILSKFALKEGARQDAPTYWSAIAHTLMDIADRVSWNEGQRRRNWTEFSVTCDASTNHPDLIDQGRIGLSIYIKPLLVCEYYGGTFYLGRVETPDGPAMEIEYKPLAGAR